VPALFFYKVRVFFALENTDYRNFFGLKVPGRKKFQHENQNPDLFSGQKILPVRAIRIFCTKTGTAGKFTTEKKYVRQVYTRYPGNYPVNGWLLHSLFSGRKLFCRNFFGLKIEKSKNFPVEIFSAMNP
jgi:hypothetical protein